MKKIILMLLASTLIFSQGITLSVGGNIAGGTQGGEIAAGTEDPKGDAGAVFGIAYDFDLWMVYVHTGVNVVNSKFSMVDLRDPSEGVQDVEYSELQIPILLKAHIFPWVVKPYLQAGITISTASEADLKSDFSGKTKAKLNGVTYMTIGGGIDIDLTAIPLIPLMFVDARLNFNAPNLFKNEDEGNIELTQAQITFGIRF